MCGDITKKTFGMILLGCDKNRVDGERLLGEIAARGCKICERPEDAQILIVNTCAFLNEARKEAIDTVLSCNALRGGGLEKIVVAGCLPQKFIQELFPALTEADVFLGISDSSELFPALERAYAGERVNAVGAGKAPNGETERVVTTPAHYKYLKIAEGCSNHCTYCLIPKIRGGYRSYPLEALVEEAKSLGDTQELLLVAQDVTRYGEDTGENKLLSLLSALCALENIHHIRLLYCYPEKISDELICFLAENEKMIKYLDIPFQHSEDDVLKRMGRKGSRAAYRALIQKIRARIPGVAIRSTFLSGFPGETEEEHAGLVCFLKEEKLENCGFFAYSREKDTPAYRMAGQIPARVKRRRVKQLYAAQAQISKAFLQTFLGKKLNVVCDGFDFQSGLFCGRAYFQAPEVDGAVSFFAKEAEVGKIYRVAIDRAGEYDLFGHTEEEET